MTTHLTTESQPQLSFPDASTLDLLIPDTDGFDIEAHLKSNVQLKPRDSVLFEELLPVYVVLRSSLASFQQTLRDIELYLTAYATTASPPPRLQQGNNSTTPEKPVKVALDSLTLTPNDSPTLYDLPDGGNKSCAVWKTTLFLRYPPQKLHRPSVHLTASAVSKGIEVPISTETALEDEYMTSALPTSENLLQSLQHSSQTSSILPYLPVSRIHKVAPRASPLTQDAKPLRTSSRLFPVFPALSVKVHITPEQVSDMLLCLDLESTRFAILGGVTVDEIKAEGNNLSVQPLSPDLEALNLPSTLQTGDKSTFLYKLARDDENHAPTNSYLAPKLSNVTFEVRASTRINDSCTAQIQARWHGNVNLPPIQPTSRASLRPQSVASTLATHDPSTRPLSKRLSTATTQRFSNNPSLETTGTTFAFSGPETVLEGETFHLDVFVVNRSLKRKRLAIVAIPTAAASSPHALRFPNFARRDGQSAAEAVVDERMIYHSLERRETRVAEVVWLNADVRVGPLPPGACHNVQLEFLTLSTGLVGLAAVHVVDLDTRETTQITELPDIMVIKALAA